MLLFELFSDGIGLEDKMRSDILDVVAPLLAHNVPFVTVQQVIDIVNRTKPGLIIDRALVLQLLDPDKVDIIQKIEGDKIVFKGETTSDDELDSQDEEEQQDQKIRKTAIDQAKKSAIDKNKPAPK